MTAVCAVSNVRIGPVRLNAYVVTVVTLQKSNKMNRDYTNIKYSATGVGGGDVQNQLSRIGGAGATGGSTGSAPTSPLTPTAQRAAKLPKQPPP